MATQRRVTTFGDGRQEQPTPQFGHTLRLWDVAIGAAYARLANRQPARIVGRILVALMLTVLLSAKWQEVSPLLRADRPRTDEWTYWAVLANDGLQIPFLALAVLLVVLRRPQIQGTTRFSGILVALGGTLIPSLLIYDSNVGSHTALAPVAILLLSVGMIWAIWSLTVLGRCFGVVPEVRGLVTSGPYQWVRHPIYLGEVIATLGLLLPILSVFHVAVFSIFCGLQLWRTKYEEVGLAATFPEYGDYQRRTARLLPGLW
jgi:protein-S-isoprenylcysteine O-methyltransferase Ste14